MRNHLMGFRYFIVGVVLFIFCRPSFGQTFKVTYENTDGRAKLSIESSAVRDRIEILNPPTHLRSKFDQVFSNVGFLFLISPHLPAQIEIKNFRFDPAFRPLLKQLYGFSGKSPPEIVNGHFENEYEETVEVPEPSRGKAAILYSAGKDSLYNLMRAENKYGIENIFLIHFSGMNDGAAPAELAATMEQIADFEIPNAVIVRLKKNSRYTGHNHTEGMRNVFLMGVGAIYAMEFGARTLITQGFAPSLSATEFTCSGRECSMLALNRALDRLGIPVQGAWEKIEELDALKALYQNRAEVMSKCSSCFTPAFQRGGPRRHWERETPTLFSFFRPNQCGSCIKCRLDTMSRLLFDPQVSAAVPGNEILYFKDHTDRWIERNDGKYPDFLTPLFYTRLNRVCRLALTKIGATKR